MERLLEVHDLKVNFHVRGGVVQAVRGVNFHVNKGEAVAIVGESGCGKSVTAQSLMRLISSPPAQMEGKILFKGVDLLKKSDKEMEAIRGKDIGMIFQDPMTSLNPTLTIGTQIIEGLTKHEKMNKRGARQRAIEMLKLVGIPNPESRVDQYPHQFSGGMRQRAMIAIALACNPSLLIADEPTTALDVTIQAQIMSVMKNLQKEMGTSIILITHDLGVVADVCDRVIVMYAGKVVETGTKYEIFNDPRHPYTIGLLRSVPRLDQPKDEPLMPIYGSPPDLISPPKGCSFCNRCEEAMIVCVDHDPDLVVADPDADQNEHRSACWMLHPYAKGDGKP